MDKHPVWWENTTLNALPELDKYWLPLFESHIAPGHGENKTAVEIGCFPGGFIHAIGKLGYQIEDMSPAERASIAARQRHSYLAAIPTKLESQENLRNLLIESNLER